jgi:FAD/FMN-containing dehydrogenase
MLPLTTDLRTRARHAQAGGIHRVIPAAVARPTSESEVCEALEWAAARGMPVTPRGAGTAMDGGSVGPGLVVDLSGLGPGAIDIDVARGTVSCSAAVTLAALDARAAAHGLRFGPDPSSAAWATVGGAIGTNAAGARSHGLGAMDRWVEGVRLQTLDGPLDLRRGATADAGHPVVGRFERDALGVLRRHREVVEARWPRTRKNTAGYGLTRFWASDDLLDLVIGAEGTLGVVTGATLRLEPIPANLAALRIVLPDRAALVDAVAALESSGPVAVELLDRSLLRLVPEQLRAAGVMSGAGAMLLVDFEDEDARLLTERVAGASRRLGEAGASVTTAFRPEERRALWAIRHAASPVLAALDDTRRSLQVIEDGCVPLPRLGDYLDGVQRSCDAAAIEAVMFGHAGDGHVHVNLLVDLTRPDWLGRVRQVHDEVLALTLQLGGTPAGEHGAGRLRAEALPRLLGEEAIACFAAVKGAFDPGGILNPGVILGDGTPWHARLKVGAAAVALPAEADAWLREVEATRRWGESRWFENAS